MTLLQAIAERPLIGDGAMGTQLQQAGLEAGGCGEHWNLSAPDKVLAIQAAYVQAGSDCLITNTFGASRIMLARHGLGDCVIAINHAGVKVARRAFGSKPGFVLGDIGPFGGLMEPYGEAAVADVSKAFTGQARALVDAGADAVIIETQTSLEELGLAIDAAHEAGAPCVIASMAFDVTFDGSDTRTMMGVSPEQAAEFMVSRGAHIAALNCGSGIDMAWAAKILTRYRAVCRLPLMAQPNAGLPELAQLRVVYRQDPEEMAARVPDLLDAGANIVGACCGSTPAHIRGLRRAVDQWRGEQ